MKYFKLIYFKLIWTIRLKYLSIIFSKVFCILCNIYFCNTLSFIMNHASVLRCLESKENISTTSQDLMFDSFLTDEERIHRTVTT